MKLIAMIGAAALAAGTIVTATPADAQRYGWDRGDRGWNDRGGFDRGWNDRRGYDRGWRGDRGWHRGWDRGRRYGYDGGYYGRGRVVCRIHRGYYGPERRCFRVYR